MWRYFTAVRMGDRKLGRCNDGKCQAHTDSDHFCLLSGRSTQSLWRHLRSHHPEIAEEEDAMLADKQAEIAKQKKDAAFQLKQFVIKPPSQLLMTEYKQTNAPKYQNNHPHQKVFDRNFKNLIVHDALPFNLAGSVWFNKLVHDLDPRLNIKHRTSYSRQVRREGKIVKRRAREHVRKAVTLSYAANVDMWRSVAGQDYMGINAQFVDSSWRWQKITTACKHFPGEHSGARIKSLLEEEDKELALSKNVIKVNVTDTASDIVAGRNVNGYSSISCGIHKLMLVGEDAEKENADIAEAIKAGAAVVNHAKHSGPFHRNLKKYCHRTGHKYSKLVTHCKTRWNSKCNLIERLVFHRPCIQAMEYDRADKGLPPITMSQWRLLEDIKPIMEEMRVVTKIWESETEPTMPKLATELFNLSEKFKEKIEIEQAPYLLSDEALEPPVLSYVRSLHFHLKRRFPKLGMDTDLGAWAHLLNPSYKVPSIINQFSLKQYIISFYAGSAAH